MTDSSYSFVEDNSNAIARPLMQKAHNRDGLPEIVTGAFLLLCAGLIYAQVILPRGSMGVKVTSLAFAVLVPILGFSIPWALRWVRRRFLIERVGYMQPKPITIKMIAIGILLVVGVSAVLFGIIPRLSQPHRWLISGSGLFAGAVAAFSGRSFRFVIGGILVTAAGTLIAFSGVSLESSFALLWGFAGFLSMLSGCVVFLHFIRQPIEPGE
ncbi:MAG: hypothetical protein WAM85_03815 [Terracidiphilus sp.]